MFLIQTNKTIFWGNYSNYSNFFPYLLYYLIFLLKKFGGV